MEIELTSVDGLPEQFKGFATGADGKFKLDLAKAAGEIDRFKGKAVTAEAEAIERRKALKAWEAFGTPDEVTAKLASGADPAIVKQLQDKMAADSAAFAEKFSGMLRSRAGSDLKAELAKAGVVPEGLDILAQFGANRLQFTEDGAIRVMASDGKTPMIGAGANGGATLSDLAQELAKSIPHLVADSGAGGGGKPAGSGGKPGQQTIKRADFLAQSPSQQQALLKSGVIPID